MSRVQPTTSAAEVLRQVDEFFMKTGPVHQTLRRLARRLSEEQIDYALIGGMALALHGLVRPTQDVDVLLTREGLDRFHEHCVGRGYVPLVSGAQKHFRDTETGVSVEVIVSGEYPGDGKPKSVVFPDPATVSVSMDDIRVIRLETLIELKLASGLSAEHRRLRDLADVQLLIETLDLPADLAENLDPSVRDEFARLWQLAQRAREDPNRPGTIVRT
jgi:hypothetical protein